MKTLKECHSIIFKMDKRIKDLEDIVNHLVEIKGKETKARENDLEKRIQNLESIIDTRKSDVGRKEPILCRQCDLSFNSKKELRKHQKEKHIPNFACTLCEKTFDVSWKLECHLKDHEVPTTFKCDTCEKRFVSEWRAKKHMDIVTATSVLRLGVN